MTEDESVVTSFVEAYNRWKKDVLDCTSSKEALSKGPLAKEAISAGVDRIKRGGYAIDNDSWDLGDAHVQRHLKAFLELLGEQTSQQAEGIEKLEELIGGDEERARSFLMDVLANRKKNLMDFIRKEELDPNLATFLAIFAARPYREAVAQAIQAEVDTKSHVNGFCPVCGHWPGLAYLGSESGRRSLWCACCGTIWSFRRIGCPYCLNSDQEKLGYLSVEDEERTRAYYCDACKRFLKTQRLEMGDEPDPLRDSPETDYLASGYLDLAAIQEGYIQESMLGTRFEGPSDKRLSQYLEGLKEQ